jgi:hypothetical protein
MTTIKNKSIVTVLVAAIGIFAGGSAQAGRGADYYSIMDAINSDNPDVIVSELERAEKLACGACINPILGLLDDSRYQVREVASWWVARRAALMNTVITRAIVILNGSDSVSALHAADWLGTFREAVGIQPLISALDAGFDDATGEAIVRALGTIGDPRVRPGIERAMAIGGPLTRAMAANAFTSIRGISDGTPLIPLLSDPDTGVRRAASGAIGAFRVSAARDRMHSLLINDPDAIVRRNAAFALYKLADPASVGVLVQAVNYDPVSYVRSYAGAALSVIH